MEILGEILGREIKPEPKAKPSFLTNITTNTASFPDLNNQQPKTKEQIIAENMERYYEHPWNMVKDGIIYTLDEVDKLNPIKKFPDDPWLEAVTNIWLVEQLFAVYKSRRMTMTWLMVFLHLWLTMFREGAKTFFVSDKEEKSDELVVRAHHIYKYIPDTMMLKPEAKYTYCSLYFPGLNSEIIGVPQGADQLRQYTASAIFCDEFAFWLQAQATFMASKPTIDGGGKFSAISSPAVSFFKDLCFDQIR